jgi:AcrR family transcriptional regulator
MPRTADPTARDALVAAARAEFARKGLRGARVEDITHACGLSKGAFYLHFESKEALFGELVEKFFGGITRSSDRRHEQMAKLDTLDEKKFLEMEMREDLHVLELMWEYRDVVGVLLRGAQGTKFEGLIWELTDGEIERIKENVNRFKGAAACRTDVPSEIFASMIVGTYVLLGMRMSRMTEKPDLAGWARSLHTLIREGSAPQAQARSNS